MLNAITVYCSSSTQLDPDFHGPAKTVGAELARRAITLVYGGGGIGLMGEIARSCQAHGGKVVGVITRILKEKEQGYDDCDELIVVETMQQRKKLMMERGDAFLVLPGGVGTYEEFFEVLAARLVGEHAKPIGIVNSDHFYDPMINMMLHGIKHRFIKPAVYEELLHIDPDPVKVIEALIADERRAIEDDRFLPMGKM
jgi:uncharacterized protein (TIGR00730 family)